jgi:type VI secretion system protein ImpH
VGFLIITVTEFHPVWIQLNEFEPTALGESCVLGRGFYDRGNCARVVIAPTTCESVLGLTPGHQGHGEIMALLRFYLGSQLAQAERPCATGAVTRVQLGTWDGRTVNTRTTH